MYSALVTLYCRFLRASHCLRLGFLPVSFEYSSSLSISFFLQRGSGVRRRPAICQAAADPSLQRAGHTRTQHRPHVLRTVFCNPGTAFRRSCPSLTPFPQALQACGPAACPPPPATPPDRDSDERAPEPGIAPRQHSSRLTPAQTRSVHLRRTQCFLTRRLRVKRTGGAAGMHVRSPGEGKGRTRRRATREEEAASRV